MLFAVIFNLKWKKKNLRNKKKNTFKNKQEIYFVKPNLIEFITTRIFY